MKIQIKDSRFKQQRLPAWRPVPTIMSIVIVFLAFGIIFIILGIVLLAYSTKVKSYEIDYTECDSDICNESFELDKDIDKPVFVYYQLDGFYQNSRRYLKSKDQLRGKTESTEDCEPAETNDEMELNTSVAIDGTKLVGSNKAIPCGLMAKTFFNDTYTFSINNESIDVDSSDIAFDKDKDLYSKHQNNG